MIEGVRLTGVVRPRESGPRMGTLHWVTCYNQAVGSGEGTGPGLGTWPAGLDGASVFVGIAAGRIVIEKAPGRCWTVGAGSDATAALPDAGPGSF